jgi:hypothetical protein
VLHLVGSFALRHKACTDDHLVAGVGPSPEATFCIFCSPVGSYFKKKNASLSKQELERNTSDEMAKYGSLPLKIDERIINELSPIVASYHSRVSSIQNQEEFIAVSESFSLSIARTVGMVYGEIFSSAVKEAASRSLARGDADDVARKVAKAASSALLHETRMSNEVVPTSLRDADEDTLINAIASAAINSFKSSDSTNLTESITRLLSKEILTDTNDVVRETAREALNVFAEALAASLLKEDSAKAIATAIIDASAKLIVHAISATFTSANNVIMLMNKAVEKELSQLEEYIDVDEFTRIMSTLVEKSFRIEKNPGTNDPSLLSGSLRSSSAVGKAIVQLSANLKIDEVDCEAVKQISVLVLDLATMVVKSSVEEITAESGISFEDAIKAMTLLTESNKSAFTSEVSNGALNLLVWMIEKGGAAGRSIVKSFAAAYTKATDMSFDRPSAVETHVFYPPPPIRLLMTPRYHRYVNYLFSNASSTYLFS